MGKLYSIYVAYYDAKNKLIYIITVYQPDLLHFESDYITRQ